MVASDTGSVVSGRLLVRVCLKEKGKVTETESNHETCSSTVSSGFGRVVSILRLDLGMYLFEGRGPVRESTTGGYSHSVMPSSGFLGFSMMPSARPVLLPSQVIDEHVAKRAL